MAALQPVDDTFQLEAFVTVLLGQIVYVVEKEDDAWMPYEFLPGTIQSKVLICGQDKTPILRDDWKLILQCPSIQDWSLFCSIFKHLPSPALVYITKEVQIPPQAISFLQKSVQTSSACILIERSEIQIPSIHFQTMNTLFLPAVNTKKIQQLLPLYRTIIQQIPNFRSLDLAALLTQISYSNLGLVMSRENTLMNGQQKWSLYWYKPDESHAGEISKANLGSWLRSFAHIIETV